MSNAQLNDRLGREPIDRLAEETHRTGKWTNQSGNGAERGAPLCTVRAEERHDFSLFYVQGKPLQGLDLSVGSHYILEFKERHETSRSEISGHYFRVA
jgi:hypothetical protein